MKRILGVKKSTNNCLIYAETGRYPFYICIYIRIVKYWFKISTASEHRYIYIIYNKCPSSWSLFVRKILYEYGFGYVWEANAVGILHPVFIKQYEQRLKGYIPAKMPIRKLPIVIDVHCIITYIENLLWLII